MAESGLVRKIAIAAAESAIPSLPALGGNVTWATPWDTILGGQAGDSDDGYLSDDAISVEPLEESILDDPPLAQAPLDEIIFKKGIKSLKFGLHSVNGTMLGLSSTAVVDGDTVTDGTTITKYALCIEITGKGLLYLPSCRIDVGKPTGSVKTWNKLDVTVVVFGTATIPAGWKWYTFNG